MIPARVGIVHSFSSFPAVAAAIDDRVVDYPGKDDSHYAGTATDWDALQRKFGHAHVPDTHWKELIFAVTDPENYIPNVAKTPRHEGAMMGNAGKNHASIGAVQDGALHLRGAAIDSYTLQALRSGYFPPSEIPFLNTSVVSCLLTSDERIVVGERMGKRAGKRRQRDYALPCGSITFQQSYRDDPIADAFYAEAKAELGDWKYDFHGVIGITQSLKGLPGLKFVAYAHVDATLAELRSLHHGAYAHYRSIKNSQGMQKARQALAEHPVFPADAWEHTNLFGLFNTPDDFTRDIATFTQYEHAFESAREAMEIYLDVIVKASTRPSPASPSPAHASRSGCPARCPQT